MSAPYALFAACAPGLEGALAEELTRLGGLGAEAQPGGVAFAGHRRVVYRANLESGLATHVLLRVAQLEARRFEDLSRGLAEVPWERFLSAGAARSFKVTARKSRLHHTGAIAERAARAIARRLGDTCVDPSPTGAPVHLRLEHDRVAVSVDTSGEPLHRRGYRLRPGPAPLREDLAHALVLASGWDRRTPLLDPFCGAGTIPIEAASIARGLAPGRLRGFAFERSPLCHAPTWAEVKEQAAAAASDGPPILGSDHSAEAIAAAKANASAARLEGGGLGSAGLEGAVRWAVATVSEVDLEPLRDGGALVTHPPFGVRSAPGRDLAPLYRALGRRLAELPDSVRVGLMCQDRRLGLKVDGRLETALLTDAGGRKVRALVRGAPAAARRRSSTPERR